jgi:hypothetical protein
LAALRMHEGFKGFIKTLMPTKAEKKVMWSALDAVCRACEHIRQGTPACGMRWQVASVINKPAQEVSGASATVDSLSIHNRSTACSP